jgi:CRP-like cAMP-binding protein/Zn-dependent protease
VSRVEARAGIWAALSRAVEAAGPPPERSDEDVWGRLAEMVDPAEFRPKLADDIEVKEFKLRWGNDYVMIANPRDLVHYRLTPEDAALLPFMDGTRTVKEIVLDRFEESGELELSGVADLVRLLHTENFLDQHYLDVDRAVDRALHPASGVRTKARKFAKTLMIEWNGADRLVTFLYRAGIKWFFNPAAMVMCGLLAAFGLAAFVLDVSSKRFTLTGQSLALGFLILIVLDYFSVFVHELGHAVVLTHNNRRVKNAGFMIYFGAPAFFVEASESLMMDRSQAILESVAGPFAQLLMGGACAMIAWGFPDWILAQTLYRTAVLNYWMVFVNLMPMLELDGYYILSDAIQMPDLRPRSLSFIEHDLWHKLRKRERLTRQEVGLSLYGSLGVLFTGLSFYTSFFYWRTVFGGLVSRLWQNGSLTRLLLLVLGAFVASPLVRGAIGLLRSVSNRVRLLARRVKFRFERSWRVEAGELIDALPLFEDLPEETLDDLAGRVRLRSFSRGQPVVRQGERASGFYVVRRGALHVVEEDPDTGKERQLRVLGRGEAFGELGLKEGAPRTATVRALDDAEVFEIDKSTFDRLLADTVNLPTFGPTVQAVVELREVPAFSHLEADELSELLHQGGWTNFAPGEAIVEQGEAADAFYAIGSGQVAVHEDGNLVRTMGPGSHFGEIGLLLDIPRTATVRARTPVRAFRLTREGFDRVIADSFRRGTLDPTAAMDRFSEH